MRRSHSIVTKRPPVNSMTSLVDSQRNLHSPYHRDVTNGLSCPMVAGAARKTKLRKQAKEWITQMVGMPLQLSIEATVKLARRTLYARQQRPWRPDPAIL